MFLDELPEYKRQVLEVLRQPLEDRVVSISRAKMSVDYPAGFMLVASMNPSPSGNFYDPNDPNSDPEYVVKRYLNKISGPLMDRIDLHIEVPAVPFKELSRKSIGETSKMIRDRVVRTRKVQEDRFKSIPSIHYNAQLHPKQIEKYCTIDSEAREILKKAMGSPGAFRTFIRSNFKGCPHNCRYGWFAEHTGSTYCGSGSVQKFGSGAMGLIFIHVRFEILDSFLCNDLKKAFDKKETSLKIKKVSIISSLFIKN